MTNQGHWNIGTGALVKQHGYANIHGYF